MTYRSYEHAPFAVKALKAGKNVLSELLPFQTMKEACQLADATPEAAVEKLKEAINAYMEKAQKQGGQNS